MLRHLTTVFVALLALFTVIDGKSDEVLEMKVFNRNFGAPRSVLCAMLKKADLEGHRGYKKEVITRMVKQLASDKRDFQTTYFYYKVTNCSRKAMLEIVQGLNASLPGGIEKETIIKVGDEIKYRHLDNMELCRVGLKVYFNDDVGCGMQRSERNFDDPTKTSNCGCKPVVVIINTGNGDVVNGDNSGNNSGGGWWWTKK